MKLLCDHLRGNKEPTASGQEPKALDLCLRAKMILNDFKEVDMAGNDFWKNLDFTICL